VRLRDSFGLSPRCARTANSVAGRLAQFTLKCGHEHRPLRYGCWRSSLAPSAFYDTALLVWPTTPWAQEVYKSVDAAGHVTYSDQPDMSNSAVDAEPVNDESVLAGMSASTAPPPLPTADQPPCPEEGDLWTPGYWAWDGVAYNWVPGVWVSPPRVGVFWTPGYWAYASTVFVFHRGYWGPQVGYYGGINYGFGYGGRGYAGGRWVGNVFAYNRAVNNVNVSVFPHVYDEPEVNHGGLGRVSYNGGPGGTNSVPTAQERLATQSRLPRCRSACTCNRAQAPRPAFPPAPVRPRSHRSRWCPTRRRHRPRARLWRVP